MIPSLPGFGFSGKPTNIVSQRDTAKLWNTLMTSTLGYWKYLAQEGGFGSIVTSWLAIDFRESVTVIHLNMLALRLMTASQDEDEERWMKKAAQAQ